MKWVVHWMKWVLVGLVFAASAQAAVLNKDYRRLAVAQPTESDGKIEVIEFFWYGCPHCYELEPNIESWLQKLPEDVVFRRIPAIPTKRWEDHARIFYVLDSLKMLDRLHRKVFDAIHKDGARLGNEDDLRDWMTRQGVDARQFNDAWGSFAVFGKVRRAQELTTRFRVDGVPTIIIQGKYVTSPSMAGGNDKVLRVVDDLIEKIRKENERASKK